MATTNRIASTLLSLGGTTQVVGPPAQETIALQLTVVQVTASLARLVVLDSNSRVVGSAVVAGTGITQILIDRIGTQLVSTRIECLKGSCLVQLDEISGLPASTGEATLNLADIADGFLTTIKIGAGAVTPAKMGTFTALKCLSAAGRVGAGAINLVGTVVGDRLVAAFGEATAGGALLAVVNDASIFEATVTVNGQIQQTSVGNLAANTYVFLLAPAAA